MKVRVYYYDTDFVAYIGVSTNTTLSSFNYSAYVVPTNTGLFIVDISSLAGNYYIYFGIQSKNIYGQYQKKGYEINEIFLTNS